jgi:hypothetical protein
VRYINKPYNICDFGGVMYCDRFFSVWLLVGSAPSSGDAGTAHARIDNI